MKYKVLIIFDQLIKPFYFLFSLLKWRKKEPINNQKFIILKFFGLGSITRIVHVMDTIGIKKKKVIFITLYKNKAIVDLLNLNAQYIKTKNPFLLTSSIFRVIFQLWNQKDATILDMERASNLSGIFRLVVAIGKPCNSFHFKPKNNYKRGQLFVSILNKSATKAIAEMFHKTYTSPKVSNDTQSDSNKIFVNINAGNYCPERKFPLSEYATLIKMLSNKNPTWHFYLTGLKSEFLFVESFKDSLMNIGISSKIVFNIAGQHNLSAFINYLKEAKLFITNDSGPLHLAYLFNIKTVGLWGPTSSELIGYQNSSLILNLGSDLACSPCFIHPKSPIAKHCQGDLTCFKSMKSKKMASEIIQFVEHQKIDTTKV